VRVGLTEREIAGRLEGALRRLGSEAHPFPTIVASGPRTALPHARTSPRAVAAGDWLLLDFGAQVDGYCADITRTVVVGAKATEAQRTLYDLVRVAQQRAREGVRAGMPGREADALARELIEARGFGDAFGHSLGHGLGLEVHEAPRLAKTNAEPLPADAVVTIEPGIYLAGQGGVRIEDDVHLAEHGPQLLSDGATALLELT
jgi:Xaa-Pro aminopeptidase